MDGLVLDAEEIVVVMCTFPEVERAREVSRVLVERRLAACVNVVAGVESVYRWQGVVETAAEVLAVIKTTRAGYAALEAALLELHPYEVPEVLALPVAAGAGRYLAWVAGEVA